MVEIIVEIVGDVKVQISIAIHVGDQWPKLQMELWAIRTQA